jgi:hypothetical protein
MLPACVYWHSSSQERCSHVQHKADALRQGRHLDAGLQGATFTCLACLVPMVIHHTAHLACCLDGAARHVWHRGAQVVDICCDVGDWVGVGGAAGDTGCCHTAEHCQIS